MTRKTLRIYSFRALVFSAASLCALFFFLLLGELLIKGLPHLRPSLFALTYSSENVSLLPSLINTLSLTILSLLLAVPLGVGAAFCLVEFLPRHHPLVVLLHISVQTLAGIPSIIYGLFGALFFVKTLHMGLSLLAGVLTLSIMVLPIVIQTAQEALQSVPSSLREASLGLGAGRVRTSLAVLLPAAFSGIFSGVLLAIGRILGESAALIFTAGTAVAIATNLETSARSLAVHMFQLASEGLHLGEAYGTGLVLVLFALVIHLLARFLAKKGSATWKN